MSDDGRIAELQARIIDQFSGRGDRADVWRGFDLFLETGAYLNLGYSPRYVPHVVGSSQRRLAGKIGRGVARRIEEPSGAALLDLGCGRGGPAIHLARRHGFVVTGLDLVPHNVDRARANAAAAATEVDFLVGDATELPFRSDAFSAATLIDSGVYIPDKRVLFEGLSRVVVGDGVIGGADLVAVPDLGARARARVDGFAEAWDFASIESEPRYRERVAAAGFEIVGWEDISRNSTARFRKWAGLFLALAASPLRGPMRRRLARYGIELEPVLEQVRATYRALPHIRHVVCYARRRPTDPGRRANRPRSA